MLRKLLFMLFALSVLAACNQIEPDGMPELTINVADWSSSAAKTSTIDEVTISFQDGRGKELEFDTSNRFSASGQKQFSLTPSKPSIKLRLPANSYIVTVSGNGLPLSKQLTVIGSGKTNLNLQLSKGGSADPNPGTVIPDQAPSFSIFGSLGQLEPDNQKIFMADLSGTAITLNDKTLVFAEDGTPSTLQTFWQTSPGQMLAVQGYFESGAVIASYLSLIPAEKMVSGDYSYLSLTGTVQNLNKTARQLDINEMPALSLGFDDQTSYFTNTKTPSEEAFWDLLADSDMLTLDGNLDNNNLKVSSAYLNDGIPSDYLEGQLQSADAVQRELHLLDISTLIRANNDTTYYSDTKGEMTESEFFAALETGVYIIAEGVITEDVLTASSLVLLSKNPTPLDAVEGQIQSVDKVKKQLEVMSPDGQVWQVKTDSETSYGNDGSKEVTAQAFWDFVEPGNYLYAQGTIEGNLSLLASYVFVSNFVPADYIQGSVTDLNRSDRQFKLDGNILITVTEDTLYFPQCEACNDGGTTAEKFWADIQEGNYATIEGHYEDGKTRMVAHTISLFDAPPPVGLEGDVTTINKTLRTLTLKGSDTTLQVSESTIYYNHSEEVTAQAFWDTVQVDDYLRAEGLLEGSIFTAKLIDLSPTIKPEN